MAKAAHSQLKEIEIILERHSGEEENETETAANHAVPLSGKRSVPSYMNSGCFPASFGPSNARTMPTLATKSMPSSILRRFERLYQSIYYNSIFCRTVIFD